MGASIRMKSDSEKQDGRMDGWDGISSVGMAVEQRFEHFAIPLSSQNGDKSLTHTRTSSLS